MEAALNAAGASLRFVGNVHCLTVRIVKVLRERDFHPDPSVRRRASAVGRVTENWGQES